jgi:glycosyltransferase involved in cell wall biosynthesis
MVSVVITTYKRPTTLERAIESVLNQTYDNIEIIVVDDNNENSEDRIITEKLMEKYLDNQKIKYIKHKKNLNGAAARNTGIKYSKGDYLTFLDDDDELMNCKIELQVEKLEKSSKDYGAVYTGYEVLKNDKVIKREISKESGVLKKELLKMEWGFGSGSNPLFKKDIVETIGGFDVEFRRYQDWEFMMRIFDVCKICSVDKILLRIHSDSRINVPNATSYVRINKQYLNKFSSYINSLNQEDKNIIYRNHFLILAKIFINNRNYKKFMIFYKKAQNFSEIRLIEKIKIAITFCITWSEIARNIYYFFLSERVKIFSLSSLD